MELNEKQKKAISKNENVVVVLAGAGSGKTTVLIEKIKKIIDSGEYSNKILAITFTNKASLEIKNRLEKIDGKYKGVYTSTFHSLCFRILKIYSDAFKQFDSNFIIIDDYDQKKVINNILKELNYEDKKVLFKINNAKINSLIHDDIQKHLDDEELKVYNLYQNYLNKNNALDFNDLLLYMHELLLIDKYREKIQKLFNYILIDEYQDTSLIQDKIVELMKRDDTKLFIVGDVDQSIYRWRGAKIENILSLEKKFDDVTIIKLEQNYRSTQNILEVANKLINHNKIRYKKELHTLNTKGEKVYYREYDDNYAEATNVINEIKYLLNFDKSIAVLYRNNYQSRVIEEKLIKENIDYQIYGGLKFYDRLEIKDMIAYLRLMFLEDNFSFLRIINTPKRKIGEKTINLIINYSKEYDVNYLKALKELKIVSGLRFLEIIDKYRELIKNDFNYFIKFLNEIKYEDYLIEQDGKIKAQERMDNINEFINGVNKYLEDNNNILDYLNDLLLNNKNEQTTNKLILSTIHGVKGMEFDVVFIVGLNEKIFPSEYSLYNDDELEEERRICYVALTRAKEKLILSSYNFDYRGNYCEESRFLKEMDLIYYNDSNFEI